MDGRLMIAVTVFSTSVLAYLVLSVHVLRGLNREGHLRGDDVGDDGSLASALLVSALMATGVTSLSFPFLPLAPVFDTVLVLCAAGVGFIFGYQTLRLMIYALGKFQESKD